MPYLLKRPLTLVRCPQGRQKKCFFQKHFTDYTPKNLFAIPIKEKVLTRDYIYLTKFAGLIALVQMAVLEIHTWGCKIDNIEKPDMVIFDLDPAPHVQWASVIDCAYRIKESLETIKLKSFVKTTGGKGLHVVVPIRRRDTWDGVIEFAREFVNEIVAKNPKDYIATMSKAKRRGKIFIDFFRNHRGATAVAPYSTRAKENAPVATPLAWHEIEKVRANSFTINNLKDRLDKLKKDPWADFFNTKQSLP